MPNDHDERAPTRHAAPTATLNRLVTPSDTNETLEAGADESPTRVIPFGLTSRRLQLLAGGVSVLLAALLLTFLANGSRESAGARRRPLPTATPTATTLPTPTPLQGFQIYLDQSQGFLVQYPIQWVSKPDPPVVDFYDNYPDFNYQVEISLPDPDMVSGQPDDNALAAAWVDYTLDGLAPRIGDQFQRIPGPVPAVHFGGAEWQSGVGIIVADSGQTRIRVQVYATIHEGKPYVLTLLAADSAFSFAEQDFFTPMLRSFQFLPVAS